MYTIIFCYVLSEATQADIEETAKMANAHNFITKFPDVRCCSQFHMLYFPALKYVYFSPYGDIK